ncbi:outer membrane protein transport protein [Myxococcota bacterium]|nr:outer membrane protein transport protein [Myxococcota bacterium]MBU1382076.1 outer membrane protein transport protein [Myxococcota bacterium]MBU1496190.1 outer membrane protein transport protein [Myxococcota bacterium]
MKYLTFFIIIMISSIARGESFLPRFIGGLDPGSPTDIRITGIYYNPAVIGKLGGTNISLYFSPNFQTVDVSRSTISSITGAPDPSGDVHFSSTSYRDTVYDFFGAITTDFGMDRITLGIAVYSPMQQNINQVYYPLRYHLIDRNMMNLFISSVVSLKMHKKFYFGFGLSYVYSSVYMGVIRDRYLRGTLPEGVEDGYEKGGIGDEKVEINTEDNNFGFSAGFLWIPKPWLTVGGSYRSKIRSLEDTSVRTSGTGKITRYVEGQGFVTLSGDAQMVTSYPDSYNLGVNMRLSRFWYGDFTVTWTRWSQHSSFRFLLSGNDFTNSNLTNWDLNINSYRGFQDTFTPQFTAYYRGLSGFNFLASLKYLPPSVPTSWVNPSAVDNHSAELLLSFTFKLLKNMNLRFGYAISYMLPVEVKNSGFQPSLARTCLENHIDVVWSSACRDTYAGKALPSAAGNYSKITHQLGIGIDLKF